MSYKVPFVNFGAQYQAHKAEYDEVITRCLEKGKLILQEDVEKFEENLAEFTGFKYAVGVADGTNAIILALKAKGVIDQKIGVTDYTFKATHEAVVHTNNKLLRFDTDEKTRLGPTLFVSEYFIPNIPVHIEGMVAPVNELSILEDAAQALGAKGVGKSGTATYSFYPAKILGCFGDGGAVCTNDKDVADKVRLYRHHWQSGIDERYGYNSRLDNVQAAFLNVKMQYLPEILKRREEIANKYAVLESITEIKLPYYQEGRVWQDYVIEVPNPKALVKYLDEAGIQTLGYGMTPNHVSFNSYKLPNVTKLYETMLRLPLSETVTDEQVEYVITKVKEFYGV